MVLNWLLVIGRWSTCAHILLQQHLYNLKQDKAIMYTMHFLDWADGSTRELDPQDCLSYPAAYQISIFGWKENVSTTLHTFMQSVQISCDKRGVMIWVYPATSNLPSQFGSRLYFSEITTCVQNCETLRAHYTNEHTHCAIVKCLEQ